jgi:hypothetical protein
VRPPELPSIGVVVVETVASTVLMIVRAGTRLYATVLAVALLVLFLPAGLTQSIGFTEFREAHRTEFGLALVACGGLLLVQLLVVIGRFATAPLRKRNALKERSVSADNCAADMEATEQISGSSVVAHGATAEV